jgi:hypothetical protein
MEEEKKIVLPVDIQYERDESRRLVERERSKWETIKRASAVLKKRFAFPKVSYISIRIRSERYRHILDMMEFTPDGG